MAATDRALVVGITRYPSLTMLGGPENDAAEFTSWLTDPNRGAVPQNRVTTILSSQFPNPNEPTELAVDDALDAFIADADQNGGQGGRRLYLFFAGHGFSPTVDEAALLTANAARGRTGHHIPGRGYSNWFRTAALFEEVVLLMDCCREIRTTAPPKSPPWDTRIGQRPAKLFLGFAADMGQASREAPSALDGNRVRGRFTQAVIEGLKHATDGQGRVTNQTLPGFVFNFLSEQTAGLTATLNKQEPRFQSSDPIVFADAGTDYSLIVTFAAGDQPDLVSGDLLNVFPGTVVDPTTLRWDLKPGLYLLRNGAKQQVVPLLGTGGEQHVAF